MTPIGTPSGGELVSPELALVDPELRARLIARLREPAPRAPRELDPRAAASADPVRPSAEKLLLWRRASAVLVVAILMWAGYALAVRLAARPTQVVYVTAPAPRLPSRRQDVARRKLAWAPAPGATAYDVALYRQGHRVFSRRTRVPSIEVTVGSGETAGATAMKPGMYEWYVWPVRTGHRGSVAIVRSRLALTGV